MSPQMIALGWGFEKVRSRHLSYAAALVEQGVQWRGMKAPDRPRVEALVREHVRGIADDWTIDRDSGGVVATDSEERVIGGLVAAGAVFDEHVVAIIRHLVVEPAWRGRGVGTVTLGVLAQVYEQSIGSAPEFYVGNCEPSAARYYQRAGFNVLQPGEPMVLPFGNGTPMGLSSQHYPCWFFRAS